MRTYLQRLLTTRQIAILEDRYVRRMSDVMLHAHHGLIEADMLDAQKKFVYNNRRAKHNLLRTQVVFDEKLLKTLVWREFLAREIDSGKTTSQIAQETETPLEEVNSYI